MANFFQGGQQRQPLPARLVLESKYQSARMNLLLVVGFTALNMILLLTKADWYFLFSASIPYFLVLEGMLFSGSMPAEYYTEELADLPILGTAFLYVMVAIAAVILGVYLLCWLLSKKHKVGWLIAALVLFSVDTLGMFLLFGLSIDSLIDILFHAWVIYSLASGVSAHYKLQKLASEGEDAFAPNVTVPGASANTFDFSVETEKIEYSEPASAEPAEPAESSENNENNEK